MASFLYDSYMYDVLQSNINVNADTFKVMLATSAYTPSRAHTKRSDITNEVSGTGYTAGGNTTTFTILAADTTNHRDDVTLGGTTWTTSTITARYAIYYKSRGGASSADELVGINDFGGDVITTAGTFTLNSSTARITNT